MAWPFSLKKQITLVSLKVANLQRKLQKGSIQVNQMKQYFTYDDPPTGPPSLNNSNEPSPSLTLGPKALVTEPPSTKNTQLADITLFDNSRNTTPDAVEALQELNSLPDLMNSTQQKISGFPVINENHQLETNALPNCVTIHNGDHQLDINTLLDRVKNRGKQQTAHSFKKKTPASDHVLSDPVITRGKQSVVCSSKTNNFDNNHNKKKIVNHNLPTDA